MAALKEIRRRIRVVGGIQQVTNAMKMVAAVKMQRAEARLNASRPYFTALAELAGRLAAAFPESIPRELSSRRPAGEEAIVVIGSDGGLCGSFNAVLFREVMAHIGKRNPRLVLIGRKARQFFSRKSVEPVAAYEKLEFPADASCARKLATELRSLCDALSLRSMSLAFQEFISPGVSRVRLEQWIPFIPDSERPGEIRCEPGTGQVLASVLPRAIAAHLHRALLESQCSEQATRMVAMDNATANAGELKEELVLVSNKFRQWSITKELLEITTGAEAIRN